MQKSDPKPLITGLDHLVLTVASIEASKNFYSGVLGLEVEIFGDHRTALKFGNMKINLHEAGKELSPHAKVPTPGSADLCFLTEYPVEKLISDFKQKGIPIVEGPVYRTGATGKLFSVYIRDPDGNLLEFSNLVPSQ